MKTVTSSRFTVSSSQALNVIISAIARAAIDLSAATGDRRPETGNKHTNIPKERPQTKHS